ncbi:MAG TPA: FAD-dependent oxidoreductase [Flavisolibacter sp.]|jgi:NADPH-dependent 2,4-dienoyl-CoA reductase/sulfur reductase-like enzyme/rhodanese-related sulfurtransferase|nr:FAD-dependent oxidoreductase [Flavisolibacter sp.]
MNYIIIGAVAGGASTAARLRRIDEKANIILFEKTDYISYANCGLPYYIGDVIKDRNKLFVQTAASFKKRFAIDVKVKTEVTATDPVNKTVTATNLLTGKIYREQYDKLVLSPGAEPICPPLPGINERGIFTLRNVADTDYIRAYVQKFPFGKAVIIGAGFIGLEMAENLHNIGMDVSIVEMADQVMAPLDYSMAALVQQHIRSKVSLHLNTTVTGFERKGDQLKVLIKDDEPLEADIVILSIGVRPDTRLAAMAGLKIGNAKGIYVNEYLQTSNPNIYAVGDAIEFVSPITGLPSNTFLAGPANKQGRICANNIAFGNVQKYEGSINTAIAKVFDMTVAAAGVAVKQLKRLGVEHYVSTTFSGSHAEYYPGAEKMTIQLAFSPGTGRVLGAQVVGYSGVDKRLDLLASVIKREGTIYELTEIEHAYAPPFSSAKDPVNIAGFVAENMLTKQIKNFYWDELTSLNKDDTLLDVRTLAEFKSGSIEGAINIPVDELRCRINELPRNKTIYVYCQIGLRGYLASRILLQNGFERVINLSGGYRLWEVCMKERGEGTVKEESLIA